MIPILDRYVAKELGAPFAISVGVFTFFLVIDRIYQLTDLVITKQVPFRLVLSLLLFLLPPLLSLTLPVALLLAVLIACGRLTGDLEVAALKASGVSPLRLFRPFLVAGLGVTAVVVSLTLVVNPWASGAFHGQLFKILQARAAIGIQERTFSGAFGQVVLYVEEASASHLALKGVLVSDERNPQLSRIIIAREGRLLSDDDQRRLTLRFIDGSINETDVADPKRFRYTSFSLYDMNLPLAPATPSEQEVKPEKEMPLRQLVASARTSRSDPKEAAAFRVELHKRFAVPMAALVFVLVGFALGIRSQHGGRVVALSSSLAVVISYHILSTVLERPALGGRLPAGVAVWLPNILFGFLGAVMLHGTTRGMPRGWTEMFWSLVARAPRLRWTRREGPARKRMLRFRRPRASTFIIDRYLVRQYFLFLGAGLLVGGAFSFVVDLLQSLDRFLRVEPAWIHIAQHFLYLLPRELYKGLPLIVLVATVFLFLSLTRQRELDALKAAGVSLYRVCLPVLGMAFLISVAALVFQETALPELTARAEEVDRVKIRGFPPRHLQRQGQMWYRSSDRRFVRIGLLDPIARSLDGLVVLDLTPDFGLANRLDVSRAEWTENEWLLRNGVLRQVHGAEEVSSTRFDYRQAGMPERIDDFIRVHRPPDAMSFRELHAYVNKLREGGHQVGAYLVQLHSKLSFPVVHVIMALVAIPFALASPRSGGRAMGVGVAIVVSVGYWVVHSAALAFARADLLPPALAAWTANIIFAGVGTTMLLSAKT